MDSDVRLGPAAQRRPVMLRKRALAVGALAIGVPVRTKELISSHGPCRRSYNTFSTRTHFVRI